MSTDKLTNTDAKSDNRTAHNDNIFNDSTAAFNSHFNENDNLNNNSNSDTAEFTKPASAKPFEQRFINREPDAIKSIKFAKVYEIQPQGTYQSLVDSFGSFFGVLGLVPCCVCCSNPYHDVQQGQVGLVTKFGELARVADPGSTYVNIFSEKLHSVSIKTEVQEIPEQACLTKDNVIIDLKSVIYYNIIDPQKAVFGISNIHAALSERTQTTLRDVIGARVLQNVIERREEIAEAIQLIISEVAEDWGVHVESILIKDLRLSKEITVALSQAAQAKRIGESKIISARAEVESAKLMKESAKLLNSRTAMEMRYLEAMHNMAKTANSKVIFLPAFNDFNNSIANSAQDDNDLDDNVNPPNPQVGSSSAFQNSIKTLGIQEAYNTN